MKYKLKYLDINRQVMISELETYKGKGIIMPPRKVRKGDTEEFFLEVNTDKDYNRLMAMNNAGSPAWEDVTTRRRPARNSEE